jgi:A/G-specific adenine glycosylase
VPVSLAEGVERLTGIRVEVGVEIKKLTYSVTRHRVVLHVHRAEALSLCPRPGAGMADARWVGAAELAKLPVGSATRRLATWVSQLLSEPS